MRQEKLFRLACLSQQEDEEEGRCEQVSISRRACLIATASSPHARWFMIVKLHLGSISYESPGHAIEAHTPPHASFGTVLRGKYRPSDTSSSSAVGIPLFATA